MKDFVGSIEVKIDKVIEFSVIMNELLDRVMSKEEASKDDDNKNDYEIVCRSVGKTGIDEGAKGDGDSDHDEKIL